MKHFGVNAAFFLFFVIAFSSCKVGEKAQLKSLEMEIKSRFGGVKGDFALVFKPLESKKKALRINADEPFHAASTMKTPVMIEVFRQAESGKFKLTDSILVKNEFKSIVDGSPFKLDIGVDSEEKLYKMLGQKQTIYSLTYDMIIWSSNLATNLVIELVDAQSVTRTMQAMGAKNMKVLRGVEDQKAFDKGLSNSTTANDLAIIMEQIALRKAVSPKASEAMIKILLDQQYKDIIPAFLPKDLKIANKTGSITGVRHDSAIVELPKGKRYVLILLSKKMPDAEAGVKMLGEVSKLVYDFVQENEK